MNDRVSDIGSSEPLVYFSSNCSAVFFFAKLSSLWVIDGQKANFTILFQNGS
jgi:hypothetical protein